MKTLKQELKEDEILLNNMWNLTIDTNKTILRNYTKRYIKQDKED